MGCHGETDKRRERGDAAPAGDKSADCHDDSCRQREGFTGTEKAETLNQRQTGIDHDRELPGKNSQFAGLHFFSSAELWDRNLAAFFRGLRHYDLLAPQQIAELVLCCGFAFAGYQFIEAVSSFK